MGTLLLFLIFVLGFGYLLVRLVRLEDRLSEAEEALAGYRDGRSEAPSPPQKAETEAGPAILDERVARSRSLWLEPPPEAADDQAKSHDSVESETLGSIFERFVGGRLLIWLGGIALVVAGIFLIRYSIEVGLLTPRARMIGAGLFGLLLVAAGEYARSARTFAGDPRTAQTLVGAGIVILYATAYGSYFLYGLIGANSAATAMVAVTGAALFLSLRHGAPTALMGLVGGFLTPWLVGDPEAGAVPLLLYLALLDLAIFAIAWRRGWTWLAALATVLSFVWTGWLLGKSAEDALAAGVFVLALAVAAPLLRPGGGREFYWAPPLVIGLAELAVLVARTDLGLAAWGLFGALTAAALGLSLLRPEQRFAPPVGLALALLLLASKASGGTDPHLALAAIGVTILFAGFALPLAPRGDRVLRSVMACSALAGPVLILRWGQPELLEGPLWGLLLASLAAAAALLAWLQRAKADRPGPDIAMTVCAATIALLLGTAALDLAPPVALAAAWTSVALVLASMDRSFGQRGFGLVALGVAIVAAAQAALTVPELWISAGGSLLGMPATAEGLPLPIDALWALALPALLLIVLGLALREPPLPGREALLALAGLFALAAGYIWLKQAFAIADRDDFELRGFAERTMITQSLFLIGWLLASSRPRLKWLDQGQAEWLGTVITLVATARLIWFDMLIHNPVLDQQWVGAAPFLNLLLPAYLLSAVWLYLARRRADAVTGSGFWLVAFLASLSMGALLMVRQLFQGGFLAADDLPLAEFYGYSLAGLTVSLALLLGGIRLRDKALRLAGLVLLTATIVKVFWRDAAALDGLLRILSFLGLGIALIGIGGLYGPILRAESRRNGDKESPAA
ncbi:DUF2339 domain-containing protein [Allosphingosinicella sp.]|jgi:uncharacterized membrane protein|uniref:DUF2339 domain-containing protein n=1 Tax=Allosphingosinicella sp. TaxID=2823234 RepID=UPI002F117B6A